MIFAIDFDGTIVEHEYPEIGKLKNNAGEVLIKIRNAGHKIIIWTCRYSEKDLNNCITFLLSNGIPFDEINKNLTGINFNPYPKIYADIYIDDRDIFCDKINWFDIERRLLEKGIIK